MAACNPSGKVNRNLLIGIVVVACLLVLGSWYYGTHVPDMEDDFRIYYRINDQKFEISVQQKDYYTLDFIEKPGYRFAGFYEEFDGLNYNVRVTDEHGQSLTPFFGLQDQTLYARYVPREYQVIFNFKDDTRENHTLQILFDEAISYPFDVDREGYDFIGWHGTSGHDGVQVTDEKAPNPLYNSLDVILLDFMADDVLILEAYYQIKEYTVTFDYNGFPFDAIQEMIAHGQNVGSSQPSPIESLDQERFLIVDGWSLVQDGEAYEGAIQSDMTLYAIWHPFVRFDTGNEFQIDDHIIRDIIVIDLPRNVDYENQRITGWEDAEGVIHTNTYHVPLSGAHLKACWERTYALIMVTNGHDELEPLRFLPDQVIGDLPSPQREGHSFTGWYSDVELTVPFVIATMPNRSVFAYPKWEVNSYSIQFSSEGGSPVASIIQKYDTIVSAPDAPEKENYVFGGWYVDLDMDEEYVFDKIEARDLVLYARWHAYRNIKFMLDGLEDLKVAEGTDILALPNPYLTDHTFSGWYTTPQLDHRFDDEIMPDHDLVLYPGFHKNYRIDFETNCSLTVPSVTVGAGLPYETPLLEDSSDDRFMGWYFDPDFETPADDTPMPAENLILYAKWEPLFTLRIEAVGFQFEKKLLEGDVIHAPEVAPTLKGHTFLGWREESQSIPFSFDRMPARNIILTPLFECNQYDVQFKTYGGEILEPVRVFFGSTVTELPSPSKDGHEFYGWYYDSAFTDPFETMPDFDITLHARFLEIIPDHDLFIQSVNGTTQPSGNVVVKQGVQLSISAQPAAGYRFSHWNTRQGNVSFGNTSMAKTYVEVLSEQASIEAIFVQEPILDMTIIGHVATPTVFVEDGSFQLDVSVKNIGDVSAIVDMYVAFIDHQTKYTLYSQERSRFLSASNQYTFHFIQEIMVQSTEKKLDILIEISSQGTMLDDVRINSVITIEPISQGFLSLPFKDSAVKIQDGWFFVNPIGPHEHNPYIHNAIDYVKGNIDQPATWQTFNVYAAADGKAMRSSGGGYGDFILIRHEEKDEDGRHYFTLYASMGTIRSDIRERSDRFSIDYDNWTDVTSGEYIGRSGSSSGTDSSYNHLHFEVHRGSYAQNKIDPYDINKTRSFYPGGDFFTGLGPEALWKSDVYTVSYSNWQNPNGVFTVLKPDTYGWIRYGLDKECLKRSNRPGYPDKLPVSDMVNIRGGIFL